MEPKQLPPYPLRMPSEVRSQLELAAKQSGRSLNAEILGRLEQSLKSSEANPEAKFERALQQQRLDSLRALYATERIRVTQLRDRVERLERENAEFEAIEAASRDYEKEAYHLELLGRDVEELQRKLK